MTASEAKQFTKDFSELTTLLIGKLHHANTIEEAIVFVLASSGHGMKTEQIAREINERKLFTRWDNAPVDGKMVYAVVMSHPILFASPRDGFV